MALVLLAPGVTACSSDEAAVSPRAYAGAVCGAVASWQGDLGTGAADLLARSATTTEARVAREALIGFLTLVVERTDRLSGDVGAAGVPSGQGGAAVAEEVRTRVEDARRLFDTARHDAERLPEDDAGAVASGAEDISRAVTEAQARIGAPLGGGAASPARTALREEPACRDLTG